jgi:hypothetical protein
MLPADEKAVLRLVSWMAQADGLVAPEEHDLLEHLVAGRLLARGWAADPEAAASLLCATPVQLEELPALVQQLATPQQRRRVSLLARHMLQVHRAPGETEEGQACEREALDQLLRVLEPPPAGSTSAAVIDHQLCGTLGGPMLPPRPESVVRLHSDRQLQLHTPAGFCPQRMRWETPIGPLPAFLGELGLLGGQRHTAFYGYAPQWTQPRCGLLLLPGGRVDFRAYAAVARELACHELVVVVQNVPFGFALLDHDRALGPQGFLGYATGSWAAIPSGAWPPPATPGVTRRMWRAWCSGPPTPAPPIPLRTNGCRWPASAAVTTAWWRRSGCRRCATCCPPTPGWWSWMAPTTPSSATTGMAATMAMCRTATDRPA